MGRKYEFGVEIISRPKAEYQSDEYIKSGLPVAPAVMVGEELVGPGPEISEEKLETVIGRFLNLPILETKK